MARRCRAPGHQLCREIIFGHTFVGFSDRLRRLKRRRKGSGARFGECRRHKCLHARECLHSCALLIAELVCIFDSRRAPCSAGRVKTLQDEHSHVAPTASRRTDRVLPSGESMSLPLLTRTQHADARFLLTPARRSLGVGGPMAGPRCDAARGPRDASSVISRVPRAVSRGQALLIGHLHRASRHSTVNTSGTSDVSSQLISRDDRFDSAPFAQKTLGAGRAGVSWKNALEAPKSAWGDEVGPHACDRQAAEGRFSGLRNRVFGANAPNRSGAVRT